MATQNPFFQGRFLAGDQAQWQNWLNGVAPRSPSASFAWVGLDNQVHATNFPLAVAQAAAASGADVSQAGFYSLPQGMRAYIYKGFASLVAIPTEAFTAPQLRAMIAAKPSAGPVPDFASTSFIPTLVNTLLWSPGAQVLAPFVVWFAAKTRLGEAESYTLLYIPGGPAAQRFVNYQARPLSNATATGELVVGAIAGALLGVIGGGLIGLAISGAGSGLNVVAPKLGPVLPAVVSAATGNVAGAVTATADEVLIQTGQQTFAGLVGDVGGLTSGAFAADGSFASDIGLAAGAVKLGTTGYVAATTPAKKAPAKQAPAQKAPAISPPAATVAAAPDNTGASPSAFGSVAKLALGFFAIKTAIAWAA